MSLLKVPRASPATPLIALTAVSFDTEATSLNVKTSEVLEFGAVALINGELREAELFQSYVSALQPIPPESTKVHGITAEKLVGAPRFTDAMSGFRRYVLGHMLLGFSIDFDLMLLEQEHQRNALAWKAPAALDVRSLVRYLRPTLPDYSLDTVAGWLNVEVTGRHSAVGDAVTTARVFLALVPLLRERGSRTLAAAVAACKQVEESGRDAGMPLEATGRIEAQALSRADSFPYRHRMEEVMSLPPITMKAEESLGDAIDLMVNKKISSLFVDGRAANKGFGIFTERDALRVINANRSGAFATKLGTTATFPLKTVRARDHLYVAIGMMRQLKVRHLGIVDESGELVGAVSQRDLLRVRADEALALTGALSDAASVSELAGIWRKLADAARALLAEEVDPRDIAAIISGEVCALTARAARMAEMELEKTSKPPSSLRYAVMVLGSGGRGESLLALDQDNAIAFTCDDEAAAQSWLQRFATRMNTILDEVGVPLCKGKVMASNPAWCKSVDGWRHTVQNWLGHTDPQDVMNADIFFDGVPVHGANEIADDVRNAAIHAASQSTPFLKLVSLSAAKVDASTNWLGRFNLDENGRMDLKRLGIMPVFTTARTLALQYQIHERSTLARLKSLSGNPAVPQQILESIIEAHGSLLGFILRQQLDDLDAGIPPTNSVDPKTFSALERERLKWALKQVQLVPNLLGTPA